MYSEETLQPAQSGPIPQEGPLRALATQCEQPDRGRQQAEPDPAQPAPERPPLALLLVIGPTSATGLAGRNQALTAGGGLAWWTSAAAGRRLQGRRAIGLGDRHRVEHRVELDANHGDQTQKYI